MIDKSTAERIKEAADIVEVVGDYVHLVRRGANYMGLCPFHNERTPSFSVNRKRNFCYCFSCHKGGSPVNFIMEMEGISYQDALRRLAQRYGIEIRERELSDEEKRAQSLRESMLTANEWAMKRMRHNLKETQEGQDVGASYFRHRGITDAAIDKFNLGYSLSSGCDLVDAAAKEGYDLEVLKELGLAGTSRRDGSAYERFHGRVMFPVQNSAGKVVAFGGRDLTGNHPAKYINSPESAVYKKSNELYGLYQARNAMSRLDKCYLVEGYFDVIGMWQSGIENVVASSGTALTESQIALIHRFASKVTLIYDGDPAGIKASLRGIDLLLAQQLDVKTVLLPDGDDPDSFARKHTPQELKEYLDSHETDFIRFKIDVLMSGDDAKDPQKRAEAIRSVVTSIASIPDPITRNVYIQECSTLLNMDEEVIRRAATDERYKILEAQRKENERRGLKRFDNTTTAEEPGHRAEAQQELQDAGNTVQPQTGVQPSPEPAAKTYRTAKIERNVMKYAIRYGLLAFADTVDDYGNVGTINVAEYIDYEITHNHLDFGRDVFGRTLKEILSLREKFNADVAVYAETLASEAAQIRRQNYDLLAQRNLSSEDLEVEEQRMEEEIEEQTQAKLGEYAIAYASGILASHENDEIRRLANEMIHEPYSLSKYYYKNHNVESETDQLPYLLPRAIQEWKDELLLMRAEEIREELTKNADADEEVTSRLLKELQEVSDLRREMAKTIGDRVVSPARGERGNRK